MKGNDFGFGEIIGNLNGLKQKLQYMDGKRYQTYKDLKGHLIVSLRRRHTEHVQESGITVHFSYRWTQYSRIHMRHLQRRESEFLNRRPDSQHIYSQIRLGK